MQLRGIEVRNIRSFEAGQLDLGPGTTLLVGDVGAGKSSLLYAVEMALFGVAEVDAAYLVRHGTPHAEVAVTLADAEHTYAIRRRFRKVRRRGRPTFEPERLTFAEDDRLAAYSATEIRQRVIELLGFPDNPNPHAHSDLWRWAIYVPQERMREILAARPDERLETVRKALGVERYRLAADNAEALARDLNLEARHRREEADRLAHWDLELAEVVRDGDRLRAERGGLAAAVAQSEATLTTARGVREQTEGLLAGLEADRRELAGQEREEEGARKTGLELESRSRAIGEEIASTETELARLETDLAERESVREARRSAEETVRLGRQEHHRQVDGLRQLAAAVTQAEAASRRFAETVTRLQLARKELEEATRADGALRSEGPAHEPPAPTPRLVAEIEEELTRATAAEKEVRDRLVRARARLAQFDELQSAGICPTCQQSVRSEDFGTHRAEAAREVEGGAAEERERAAARERLEEERKSRERYDRALERWQQVARERATAAERRSRAEIALSEAVEAERQAAAERDRAIAERTRLEPLEAENARRQAALESAERTLRERMAADERLGRAEERRQVLRGSAARLSDERQRVAGETQELALRAGPRHERISSLRTAVAGFTQASARLEVARKEEANRTRAVAEARAALVRADAGLDHLAERQAACERGRTERAGLVARAVNLEARAAWVSEPFREALLRMEKELLGHAQVAFDRAFARFFATLVDDPALTARIDVSFTPEVSVGPDVTPAEALSGGERTSLALAFRLALATVVRSLGGVRLESLLLDEPTDGFSGEQVVRMGELLEELALPQVILVSHESQLVGIADRTVRVVKTEGRSALQALDAPAEASTPAAEAAPAEVTLATRAPGRPRTR